MIRHAPFFVGACALAIAIVIPVSALRLTAEPPNAQQVAEKTKAKSDSEVEVKADVEEDLESVPCFAAGGRGQRQCGRRRPLAHPDTVLWIDRQACGRDRRQPSG